jgi:hypothetical protein
MTSQDTDALGDKGYGSLQCVESTDAPWSHSVSLVFVTWLQLVTL